MRSENYPVQQFVDNTPENDMVLLHTIYASSFCINSPVGWVTHVTSQYEHYTPEVCFITNLPEKLPGPKKKDSESSTNASFEGRKC